MERIMVKQILHEVDEEIKLLEGSISSLTIELDEYYNILRDSNIKVIDNKITQDKFNKATVTRNKYIIRLNEALRIKHIIEKYKD